MSPRASWIPAALAEQLKAAAIAVGEGVGLDFFLAWMMGGVVLACVLDREEQGGGGRTKIGSGEIALHRTCGEEQRLAARQSGRGKQQLLPNTSALQFTAARSVTIQILPERSTARLSGLAKPMPPCQGVPPVATIRQRNTPPGCSGRAAPSSRRISLPKGQVLSPTGPWKTAGSACPSPSDPPAVKVISRSPVRGSNSMSSGRAVGVAPAALAAKWASMRIAPSCSSPPPG
ncbi:MAG: hypothetical protein RLZZ609_2932 [Cyanobacteriota bacterium]